MQGLTQTIEKSAADKQDAKANPTIVPISINNSSSSNSSSGSTQNNQNSGASSLGVPRVRNQDGTIQRLLDLNYTPLMA